MSSDVFASALWRGRAKKGLVALCVYYHCLMRASTKLPTGKLKLQILKNMENSQIADLCNQISGSDYMKSNPKYTLSRRLERSILSDHGRNKYILNRVMPHSAECHTNCVSAIRLQCRSHRAAAAGWLVTDSGGRASPSGPYRCNAPAHPALRPKWRAGILYILDNCNVYYYCLHNVSI